MKYFKQPSFSIGLIILVVLLSGSITYSLLKEESTPSNILYDDKGKMIDRAPFERSAEYPLGSDQFGNNYVFVLLEGAKYTLGFVVLITISRMVLSILISFILLMVPSFIKKLINRISDIFYFAPLSIFAYLLIAPAIIAFSWSYSDFTQFMITTCVLVVLTVPVLSVQIANEISILSKEEFIHHAPLLGGGRIHIFMKHILPCLSPKLLLLTVQQAGQTLAILAHLAFLKIFVGGFTKITYTLPGVSGTPVTYERTFSDSHEWGSLIVQNWDFYYGAPILVIAPVCCFVLCTIAINLMVSGMAKSENQLSKKQKKKITSSEETLPTASFMPVKKERLNA